MTALSASALVLVGRNGDGELLASVAVEFEPIPAAPIGEGVRINIDTFDDVPLTQEAINCAIRAVEPLLKSIGESGSVTHDLSDFEIILLAIPRNDSRPRRVHGHPA